MKLITKRGVSVKITFAEVPKIEEISIAAFILIVGQQLIINVVNRGNLNSSFHSYCRAATNNKCCTCFNLACSYLFLEMLFSRMFFEGDRTS